MANGAHLEGGDAAVPTLLPEDIEDPSGALQRHGLLLSMVKTEKPFWKDLAVPGGTCEFGFAIDRLPARARERSRISP